MKLNIKIVPTGKPADEITPRLDVTAVLSSEQATQTAFKELDCDTLTPEEKVKVDDFINLLKEKSA